MGSPPLTVTFCFLLASGGSYCNTSTLDIRRHGIGFGQMAANRAIGRRSNVGGIESRFVWHPVGVLVLAHG